ncbi:MAG: RNA polymerase sigma factor [Flammeovirgaceae bacterium]
MNSLKKTDEQIVVALKKSFDAHLFNELIGRYERKIINRCREYVRDEDAAKDLAQEVMIKLFLKFGDFKETARFSSWLYAIVNNTCLDFLRKNKKKFFEDITTELADSLVEISDVNETIPIEESIEIVEKLMEELPPEDKMILLLKYKENVPIKEIQVIMNLSESAVKMRIKRAKEKVAKLHKKINPNGRE